jgi:hypothetical protein
MHKQHQIVYVIIVVNINMLELFNANESIDQNVGFMALVVPTLQAHASEIH